METEQELLAHCAYVTPDYKRDVSSPNLQLWIALIVAWALMSALLFVPGTVTTDRSGRATMSSKTFGRYTLPTNVDPETASRGPLPGYVKILMALAVFAIVVALVVPLNRSRERAFQRRQVSFNVYPECLEILDSSGHVAINVPKTSSFSFEMHEEMAFRTLGGDSGIQVWTVRFPGGTFEFDSTLLYVNDLSRFFGAEDLNSLSGTLNP